MRKSIQKVLSFALAGAMVLQPLPSAQSVFKVNAGVASESKFDIPQADASGRVGAKVPYTRYDSYRRILVAEHRLLHQRISTE